MGRVPLPQVVLFAAMGWLPAVALAVAVALSLTASSRPQPAPVASPKAEQPAPAASPKAEQPAVKEAVVAAVVVAPKATPRTTRTLLTRSGAGSWTGTPGTAVPDVPMTVAYRAVCRTGPPFLTVSWDGDGPDYDYLTVTGALRMAGTGRLDPASAAGRFEVRTRADCAWTIRITQTS